jgi:hypothetical protein
MKNIREIHDYAKAIGCYDNARELVSKRIEPGITSRPLFNVLQQEATTIFPNIMPTNDDLHLKSECR